MTTLHLQTIINAPIEICFDLSRSIDVHQRTTVQTKERAVGGKTAGLIELGEFVTWEATHFHIKQRLTTKIVEMSRPHSFTDVMTKGAFKSMWHLHSFNRKNDQTVMTDEFKYDVPFGLPGKFFNHLVLKRYMRVLLQDRNVIIKKLAEGNDWKSYLSIE
jgi:ligand-binding SRPBCC domain-containing protein